MHENGGVDRTLRPRSTGILGRVHPVVPFLIWFPVAVGTIALGVRRGIAAPTLVGLVAVGWAAWTLVEYVLHRWAFHWEPRNPRLRELLHPVHHAHHEAQGRDRVVAHPLFSAALALVFFGLFRLLLGAPAVFPFFGGFALGYLVYELIHYRAHFSRPRTRVGSSLRRRHLQHHFARSDRWYGVSSPIWDYVFRTHVPARRKNA